MTEWQPIETAPKDGRRFLVYTSYKCDLFGVKTKDDELEWDVFIARYGKRRSSDPEETALIETLGPKISVDCGFNCWAVKPTHWMPYPEPPEDTK